jgi:hypothetical protein
VAHTTSLIERYQDFRTRRFLRNEQAYARSLPGWRTRARRRALIVTLAVTFAFMFAVSVLCATGVRWAPLLWLPAVAVAVPAFIALQVVSGRQGDAPRDALDERELAERDSARSIGLTVTQTLTMIPAAYLIIGSVAAGGDDGTTAYAGGLMLLTVLMVGGAAPAMILGWSRPDDSTEPAPR